jgi:hypothetical protein
VLVEDVYCNLIRFGMNDTEDLPNNMANPCGNSAVYSETTHKTTAGCRVSCESTMCQYYRNVLVHRLMVAISDLAHGV